MPQKSMTLRASFRRELKTLHRVLVPLACSLLCVGLLAAPALAGTPAQNLEDAKAAGAVFASAELFSHSVSLTEVPTKVFSSHRQAADALEHGTLLTLDLGAVRALNEAAPEALRLEVPFETTKSGRLTFELLKVNPLTPDFEVVTSSPEPGAAYDFGTHYRGVVAGDSGSLAAVSVFADELMVFADTTAHGIVSVGALEGRTKGPRAYVAFADDHLKGLDRSFECGFDDSADILGQSDPFKAVTKLPIERPGSMGVNEAVGDCVKIYLEADYNIYQNKGSTQATVSWMTGVYNQVATLYEIDNIETGLSQVFVWNSSSPYTASGTAQLLSQFQSTRTSYNGNLAHLMKLGGISGRADGFNGICTTTSQSQSVAFVQSSYSNVPNYSGTVFVVAHEIGHTAGSRHTHACVWNGNNTAIDGCSGFTEGNCALPGNPWDGGTIMSYCPNASVGVNFSKGFDAQPASVIHSRIANANCLQASCRTIGGPDQNCRGSVNGVSVAGCLSSGTGDFLCQATVGSGSGSYNYWWTYEGPGQLFQTNSPNVSITGCQGGEGSLTVQVLDRDTGDTCRSRPYRLVCDCSFQSPELCDVEPPF